MTSKILWLFLFVFLYFNLMPIQAQIALQIENKRNPYHPVSNVIKGGVSVSSDFPDDLYGTWQVTGVLIDTNRPDLFKLKSTDIWILQKNNEVITLTNPETGASSSITLNAVKGKTAIFSRKEVTEEKTEYERPRITVDGENFYGTDELVLEEYKNGELTARNTVKYDIIGQKLSGMRIKQIFSVE